MSAKRAHPVSAAGRFTHNPAARTLTTEEFADLFEAQALGQVDDVGRRARLQHLHAAGLLQRGVEAAVSRYTLSEAGLAALEGH